MAREAALLRKQGLLEGDDSGQQKPAWLVPTLANGKQWPIRGTVDAIQDGRHHWLTRNQRAGNTSLYLSNPPQY